LFEAEVLPLSVSQQLQLSYPTVLKAYHTIRRSLLPKERWNLFSGKERQGVGSSPVFGLIHQEGKIHFGSPHKVTPHSLLRRKLKMQRLGNAVYTEKFLDHDAMIFWGDRELKIKNFLLPEIVEEKMGQGDRFRSFAQSRLQKHHGISQKLFPLYLGEMIFRFNHQGESLFHLLADHVSQSVAEI
jgi:transposase